jgi:hypothetical protein
MLLILGDDARSGYRKAVVCTNIGARAEISKVPKFLRAAVRTLKI